MEKQGIKLEVPYSERISRLFIFRMLWMFVLIWPSLVIMVWLYLVSILHFLYMLVLGKRQGYLWGNLKRAFVWTSDWNAYFGALTDKRPNFWW